MRIAIIDTSRTRAALISDGLCDAGLNDIVMIEGTVGLVAQIEVAAPEVVLINLENPGRDVLEEFFVVSRALARPIAMFIDQSSAEATAAAVDAGVSAYVVDGLQRHRIAPIVELAVRRFQAFAKLEGELRQARDALAERLSVDRAKTILMRRRSIDEPAAYAMLRTHAMRSNRRLAEVAEAIVTSDALLGELP